MTNRNAADSNLKAYTARDNAGITEQYDATSARAAAVAFMRDGAWGDSVVEMEMVVFSGNLSDEEAAHEQSWGNGEKFTITREDSGDWE